MGSFDIESILQEITEKQSVLKLSKILQTLRDYIRDWKPEFAAAVQGESGQALLCNIANAGAMKDFPEDACRDYEASDFVNLAANAELSFSCLGLLCQRSIDKDFPDPGPQALVSILLLCGAHHQIFLWTSNNSVAGSKDLCEILCKLLNKRNVYEILTHPSENGSIIVKDVLTRLRCSLNAEKWRRNPCNPRVYKWLLFHLKHSELPDLLPDVLPPALLLADDHTSENKLLGIKCLHHIIINVPPTVLRWQGRADVVYDALRHLLYTHEPEVILALHPCLLDLLGGMEPDPNLASRPQKSCRYDELFSSLLSSMALEQKIKLRNLYATQLPLYVNKMGITVLSHSKRLFEVVDEYLSVYDGPSECSRLNVLLAVQLIIKVAWPRMPSLAGKILKALLRLLFDLHLNPPSISETVKDQLIFRIEECLSLLHKACPSTFQDLTSEIIMLQGPVEPVIHLLKNELYSK